LLLAAPFICAEIRYQTDINETAKKHKDAGYYYYGFTFQVINNTYGLNVILNDLPSDKNDALERIVNIIESGLLEDVITTPEFIQHGYCPIKILVLLPDDRHPFGWIPSGSEEDEIAESKLKAISVTIKPDIDKDYDITHIYYHERFDVR
jgi:hypothetical protein